MQVQAHGAHASKGACRRKKRDSGERNDSRSFNSSCFNWLTTPRLPLFCACACIASALAALRLLSLKDPQEANGHLDWGPVVAPGALLKNEHGGAGLTRVHRGS